MVITPGFDPGNEGSIPSRASILVSIVNINTPMTDEEKRQHDINNILAGAIVFYQLYSDCDSEEELVDTLREDEVLDHVIDIVVAMYHGDPYDHFASEYVDAQV